jgi:hypothetical protein
VAIVKGGKIMLFRKEAFDEVRVINTQDKRKFERTIEYMAKDFVVIDLQFSTSINTEGFIVYSALALLRKK